MPFCKAFICSLFLFYIPASEFHYPLHCLKLLLWYDRLMVVFNHILRQFSFIEYSPFFRQCRCIAFLINQISRINGIFSMYFICSSLKEPYWPLLFPYRHLRPQQSPLRFFPFFHTYSSDSNFCCKFKSEVGGALHRIFFTKNRAFIVFYTINTLITYFCFCFIAFIFLYLLLFLFLLQSVPELRSIRL